MAGMVDTLASPESRVCPQPLCHTVQARNFPKETRSDLKYRGARLMVPLICPTKIGWLNHYPEFQTNLLRSYIRRDWPKIEPIIRGTIQLAPLYQFINETWVEGWIRSMLWKVHEVGYQLFKLPLLNYKQFGEELLDSTLSFFFVRHPFVRLVSAYQDKASWSSENNAVSNYGINRI